MDYDDNDFQSQNFQLASEDSNKFPSSLRAFGLPKYDLDEHLQVHLRFDSLVDTEPLLAINDQKSNWIDDFSAGSNAIDFSSGATESCSIGLHNNVWSEATSESVEMLLKSVGEDEILDQHSTIKEANFIEGFKGTDNQIGMSMRSDPPNAESFESFAKDSIPPNRSQNTCLTVEEMEDQSNDVSQGGSVLEHPGSTLGESFLAQKMDCKSVMEQCKIDEMSYNVAATCVDNKEIQCDADKQLEGGFMKSNLEDSENFNECVPMEVHGSKSPQFEVCPSDVSVKDNNNTEMKLSAEVLSEHVMEEQSAIGFSAAHPKNSDANYQCSEGNDVHHDHQYRESSMEVEVSADLSAPMKEGCTNFSFPSENADMMLESGIQHQNYVESFTGAEEYTEQIRAGCPPTMASDTCNKDAGKLSHLEVHFSNTYNSRRVDSQLNKTIDVGVGHGEQRGSDTLGEAISETQGSGSQLTGKAAGSRSSTEIAIERPNVEDCDRFVFGQPISQTPELDYKGRYNNEVGEKSEPTLCIPKDDSCHISTFPIEDSDVGNGYVKTSELADVHAHCDPSVAEVKIDDSLCKDQCVQKTTEKGDWSTQKTSQDKAEQQDSGVLSPIQGIVTFDGKQNAEDRMETSDISHIPSKELETQSTSANKGGTSSATLIHDDAVDIFPNKSQQSWPNPASGTILDHHGDDLGSNQGSSQPACGMMAATGSSDYSQDEKGHLLESFSNVSGDGKVDSVVHESKHGASSQNGKGVVSVNSSLNLSSKVIGDEKGPVLNIQPVDFSQRNEKSSRVHLKNEEGKRRETASKKKEEKNMFSSSTEKVKSSRRRSAKEPSVQKQTPEKNGNAGSRSPLLLGPLDKDLQSGLMQIRHAYGSSSRASCSPAVQKSGLPDLNSSVSPSALLHQPFTDLQQLQLRAQIFVYGSLIQGTPPDEACMISAFGGTDDSRNMWTGLLCAAVEWFQNQKSPLSSFESPILSRSGIRISKQMTECSTIQSKTLSPPVSWSVSKVLSTMSLPSPLGGVSNRDGLQPNILSRSELDFGHAISRVYSYQATQRNEHIGSGAVRPSQANVGTALVPQSSKADTAAHFLKVSLGETVRATLVRDTPTLSSSSMQLQSASALVSSSAPAVEAENKAASTGIIKNQANIPKSRKKKKAALPEGLEPSFLTSLQAQVVPVSVTGIVKPPPAPTILPLPVNAPVKLVSPGPLPAATHSLSLNHYLIGGVGIEQRGLLSEEICGRTEQVKLHAEDAAAYAASAVRHSQGIWSRLVTQKNSGLISEVEEKLASAAAAAAAAASVAKAAAAAANVASDVALQAKMMADEALSMVRAGNMSKTFDPSLVDVGKSMASLIPVSILKGKDKTSGSSVALSAAKKVARKRMEAASTASKRAENMDAIVKAAELAAEAVAQAGMLVAMGDRLPLTLNELAEAGPEGFWRARPTTEHLSNRSKQPGMKKLGVDGQVHCDDSLKLSTEHRLEDENMIDYLPQQQFAVNEKANASPSDIPVNIIQKNALVEVVSDEHGLGGVWFSAHVLDVKDGKAYVCYDDLLRGEGSGQIKDWIPLEEEGNKPPRIRVAHPISEARGGGKRKRRREALSNYTWAIGDRVDALIRDGWREGIITDKNKEDETKLTVHFLAGGDSAPVRAWNLRPSLIWKDGQWREWMRPREDSFNEGDTPQEKRQRVTRSAVTGESEPDVGRDDKQLKNARTEASRRPEESQPLPLSAKERIFSMGDNGTQANTFDALKLKRTGLQEGSRVVFGVPKPGKKRKFMAVSEHYVAGKADKASEGNDALKLAKYLMPQAPRSWRTTSKAVPRGRGAGDSRLRRLKSVKSQSIRNKSLSDKDGKAGQGPSSNAFSNEENKLAHDDLNAGSPNSYGGADNAVLEEPAPPAPSVPSKKIYSSLGGEAGLKGKRSNIVGKSTKIESTSENSARTIPDATEPRRSNRRIQPTSRLLEGLQSSLLISKIPSASHDKGSKVLHRGKSSSRGRVHG